MKRRLKRRMRKMHCFKNSPTTGVETHAPISEETYREKMMRLYSIYNRDDVKCIVTHNYELCDLLIKDFGEDIKIYILALTWGEYFKAQNYVSNHKNKQNIFVIFNEENNSDFYYKDTYSCLEKIQKKAESMNIKFNDAFYISNPPFNGSGTQQIYPKFYKFAIKNFKQVLMIFPSTWQGDNTGSGLSEMTNDIKRDKQIVYIDNIKNAFPDIHGAEKTCVICWKRGYDNGHNGKQEVYTDGECCDIKDISICSKKPRGLNDLVDLVKSKYNFVGVDNITSMRNPYGFCTDILNVNSDEKYGLPPVDISKLIFLNDKHNIEKDENKINLYGLSDGTKRFCVELDDNYPMKKKSDNIGKYKIFYTKNWGNFKDIYGGKYSSIIIGRPNDICSESFIECGSFDTLYEAQCHSKYMLTKFARYLLLDNKTGIAAANKIWRSVPVQDYSEDWWSTDDINEIDKHLFDKYDVPEYIRKDIENVRSMDVEDIFNYGVVHKIEIKKKITKSKHNEQVTEPLWD